MSAQAAVLSNHDLSRAIVGHHPGAVTLYQASHEQRSDRCARLLEIWARYGCPLTPAPGLEAECLASQGGLLSRFCRGVWNLSWRDGHTQPDLDGEAVTRMLANELARSVEKSVKVSMGLSTVLTVLRVEKTASYAIVVTTDGGWRKKGTPCRPTADQVERLLHAICTETGVIALPCPRRGGSAPTSIHVPRRFSIELRWNGIVELRAIRR